MGQCAGFANDNVIQYFDNGASANLGITGSLSIDAWIKWANPISPPQRMDIYRRITGAGGYLLHIQNLSLPGRNTISFTKAGVISLDSTVEIQTNRVTHVAVVWDSGSGNVYFYRDGVLIQTIPNASALIGGALIMSCVNSNNILYKMNKCIYNLNIYNRALSAPEILYNKEHPNNPIRRGLQLGLTQESFAGGVWKDISPNAYDGTPVGSPTLTPCNNLAGRNVSL